MRLLPPRAGMMQSRIAVCTWTFLPPLERCAKGCSGLSQKQSDNQDFSRRWDRSNRNPALEIRGLLPPRKLSVEGVEITQKRLIVRVVEIPFRWQGNQRLQLRPRYTTVRR